MIPQPITADWLKSIGFKWHQFDRQPDKHWLLWIGEAMNGGPFTGYEDIGLELAPNRDQEWFCWFRSDTAGRYHRFIHIRHLKEQHELTNLISALTGTIFNPAHVHYGHLRSAAVAARLEQEAQRLDLILRTEGAPWSEVEKDDTRGRSLPEHMEAAEKAPNQN